VRRFAFRLEKLLEYRSFYERRAELVLAEKSGRCALLENRLAEIAQSRARAGRDMFAPGRDLADFRASELYIIRLDRERDKLLKELVLAQAEREKARLEYLDKHRNREVIDKLKERREKEYYHLAQLEEIKTLDDIGRRSLVETGR
jgi:flagellar protein FliJ